MPRVLQLFLAGCNAPSELRRSGRLQKLASQAGNAGLRETAETGNQYRRWFLCMARYTTPIVF
jgi:hypothetical protein